MPSGASRNASEKPVNVSANAGTSRSG